MCSSIRIQVILHLYILFKIVRSFLVRFYKLIQTQEKQVKENITIVFWKNQNVISFYFYSFTLNRAITKNEKDRLRKKIGISLCNKNAMKLYFWDRIYIYRTFHGKNRAAFLNLRVYFLYMNGTYITISLDHWKQNDIEWLMQWYI